MLNNDLHRLMGQLDALRDASVFNARERADAVADTIKRLLIEYDRRLQRLEKIYENAVG